MSCYDPQNGDRFVTVDSVTSLHPMYSPSCAHTERCFRCFAGKVCHKYDSDEFPAQYLTGLPSTERRQTGAQAPEVLRHRTMGSSSIIH